MAAKSSTKPMQKSKQPKLSTTEIGREQQMQAMAWDLARERMENKTASNQLICQIIKSSSPEHKLKLEIMEEQKKLYQAKTKAIESQEKSNVDFQELMKAIKVYSGFGVEEDEDV